jgi:hypothetical protein
MIAIKLKIFRRAIDALLKTIKTTMTGVKVNLSTLVKPDSGVSVNLFPETIDHKGCDLMSGFIH